VPPLLWEVPTGACVEASPTVWNGTVYIGSRDGYMYALRDRR
jgi:outer membrane protein assembly factor BamB